MSRVTMKLEGLEGLQAALGKMTKEIEAEVDKAVDATGLELRGNIIKNYQRGPTSGATYEKYNPRRTHRASAPGEAPATDTGRLASSVNYKKDGAMSATVGSELVYAALLEFSTTTIAARPNWVPETEKIRPKFNSRIEAALARATR